jgi:endonuclease/exonuclease/phosphatase family metal-dependent hydrolase/predicted phosphodiesterase
MYKNFLSFIIGGFLLTANLPLNAQAIFPRQENSLRIMTYNIRNCVGMDNRTDYQRVADVINRVSPDVVAIQETDSATRRGKGVFVLKELAERTLMHCTFAPAIDFQGGKYGTGILSKEKPVALRQISLPGDEKRTLLIAEFDRYVVCCTHLALEAENRKQSVSLIINAVKDIQKPLFLAGDMNAAGNSPELTPLSEKFTVLNDVKKATFPADKPVKCIDFIYGSNGYSVLERRVLDEPVASDHRPLYVDVRLKAEAKDIFRTKPYLQNPVNNGITVSWFTNVATESWVEYGTGGKLDKKQALFVDGQMICNNKFHKIRLTGLQAGQTYGYRVCSREITLYEAYKKEFGETVYSDVYHFTLPAPDKADFTAVILNDLHQNRQLTNAFGKMLKEMDYDFVVFNGDFITDPKDEQQAVGFLSEMNEKTGAEHVPVFYVRGNHEIRNAYSIQLRSLFDYVGDRVYSAFNWGDTRIVILDCGEDKPDTTPVYYGMNDFDGLRREQADFLKTELKGKAFKTASGRVLIHHIPLYDPAMEYYNPCKELWGNILAKAPFDVCLNAHTHRFAYYPKGQFGNNFPVVTGGGDTMDNATMMILQKKGKNMTLRVVDTKGKEKIFQLK